jgi:hypothetical protein
MGIRIDQELRILHHPIEGLLQSGPPDRAEYPVAGQLSGRKAAGLKEATRGARFLVWKPEIHAGVDIWEGAAVSVACPLNVRARPRPRFCGPFRTCHRLILPFDPGQSVSRYLCYLLQIEGAKGAFTIPFIVFAAVLFWESLQTR